MAHIAIGQMMISVWPGLSNIHPISDWPDLFYGHVKIDYTLYFINHVYYISWKLRPNGPISYQSVPSLIPAIFPVQITILIVL